MSTVKKCKGSFWSKRNVILQQMMYCNCATDGCIASQKIYNTYILISKNYFISTVNPLQNS